MEKCSIYIRSRMVLQWECVISKMEDIIEVSSREHHLLDMANFFQTMETTTQVNGTMTTQKALECMWILKVENMKAYLTVDLIVE